MHLTRAPSCTRRGLRWRHDGTPVPRGVTGRHQSIYGGCEAGASRPCSLCGNTHSHRAGKGAPINKDILAGDVSGLGGAQEGTRCAEFVRAAEASCRHHSHALSLGLVKGDALASGVRLDVGLQAFGIKGAG